MFTCEATSYGHVVREIILEEKFVVLLFLILKNGHLKQTTWNPITSDEGAFCRQSKKKLVTQGGSFTLNFKYFI